MARIIVNSKKQNQKEKEKENKKKQLRRKGNSDDDDDCDDGFSNLPSSEDEFEDSEEENNSDSDSDSDNDEENSDYETVDSSMEETETSGSSTVEKKKKNKRKNGKNGKKSPSKKSKDEDEDDDNNDSDNGDEEDSTAAEENKKIKKALKSLFESIIAPEEKKKKEKKSKKQDKKKNHKKKRHNSSHDEEDEEDDDVDEEDEYDEDEEDDENYETEDAEEDEKKSSRGGAFITIQDAFAAALDPELGEYKKILAENKHEKCTTDDEKVFMSEAYVPITESELKLMDEDTKKKSTKKVKKEKEIIPTDIEQEYAELIALRKTLNEQLQKKPKSKILKKAIKECQDSISKLVKRARMKNIKAYYKLVHEDEEENRTSELAYFQKNLSNKQQLKIMQDLKEINKISNIIKPYRLSILESNIPAKFKAIALQKLKILNSMEPGDPEYYKLKNWVDGFMRVPFGIYKNLTVNLNDGLDACHQFMENAKNTLDNCVYGLNDAKLQILQMVGQWISNPGAMGTAIAIKGPMGTGKTTLVKDGISKILGREFAFIALGGAGDSSFLEGHSYTYEGSCWGKIMQIIMESKSMNPVIYFDELDKISESARGEEIVNILIHLTDTTQNCQYHDKYFSEVDFDLSKCMFIFSYNDESRVSSILKDRMYRIQTKGYEAKEKTIIARKHLLPKIREQVNFTETDIIIPDDTLQYIISSEALCKGEQGVRNLKRCLEIIYTKLNLFRLIKPGQNIFSKEIEMAEVSFPFTVTKKHVDILIKKEESINQSMLAMYV